MVRLLQGWSAHPNWKFGAWRVNHIINNTLKILHRLDKSLELCD